MSSMQHAQHARRPFLPPSPASSPRPMEPTDLIPAQAPEITTAQEGKRPVLVVNCDKTAHFLKLRQGFVVSDRLKIDLGYDIDTAGGGACNRSRPWASMHSACTAGAARGAPAGCQQRKRECPLK